ncbi:MAG: acyl-CoA dehydrogenase family protein, partial [Acidimicrobiales bacterium]|nr:acyl-CoA dehydrogenase family protein [Acidimicrobiales bacterium]
MDLTWTAEEDAFRAEVRAWLATELATWRARHDGRILSGDTTEGFAQHLEWERTLFDAGYAAVSWPTDVGGRGASRWEWLIFEEEYYRAGAPQRVTQNGIFLLAPTIFEYGTEEQQDRLLRRMAA